jgi:hypothetical protein
MPSILRQAALLVMSTQFREEYLAYTPMQDQAMADHPLDAVLILLRTCRPHRLVKAEIGP